MVLPKMTKTVMMLHKLQPREQDAFGSELNKFNTRFLFKEIAKNSAPLRGNTKNVQIHPMDVQ